MTAPPTADVEVLRSRRSDRGLDALAIAALWLPYAWLARYFWFVTDDAYISFRYARNWAQGNGLRYNLSDATPVEGFSNFLWVALAALCEWMGADVEWWMPRLSFACGAVLIAWLYATIRSFAGADRGVAVVATGFVAWSPAMALHASTGLETVSFALLLFVAFDRMVVRERIYLAGATLCGVGLVLLRVEGVAWALALVPLAVLARSRAYAEFKRPLAAYALAIVATALIGTGLRLAYYGDFVSNTVRAKAALGPETLLRGIRYVAHFALAFVTPAALVATVPACLSRRWRSIGAPALMMAAGVAVFAVMVGGDFMAMGRFLVPGLAFIALAVAIALVSRDRRGALLAGALALLAAGLLPTWDLHIVPESVRRYLHVHGDAPYLSDHARWEFQRDNARLWSRTGAALGAWAGPGDSVVLGAIGAVGYFSNLTVYDRNGLVDREVARLPARRGRPPGHDKEVSPFFFVDRAPTYLFVELASGATANEIVRVLEANATVLRAAGLDGHYVPRAVPVAAPAAMPDGVPAAPAGTADPPTYLLLAERIREPMSPARAWKRYRRMVERIGREPSGGD